MAKAAKLGWAGPGTGQMHVRSRLGANQEQGRSRSRAGAWQEQGRSRIEKSRAEQSRADRGQELVGRWARAGKEQVRSTGGAGQ